jgi:hypothetical protein
LFLSGEFSPNFNLKNMISTYTEGFHEKNGPSLPDFEGKKKRNLAISMISSSRLLRIKKDFGVFSTFISSR